MNLPPSNRRAGQDRAAYEHVASQLCVIYYAELGRNSRLVPTLVVVGDIISFPVPATTSTMQMYVILFFLGVSLFQDLIFFQDSDMSSYIGFHCYKISSLFEDLASMNKTLSISVGLNSHACNGQDVQTLPKRVRITTQQHTPAFSLSVGRHGKIGATNKTNI